MNKGIRSAKKVARDEGVSEMTIWRRIKQGLLTKVNINGRAYITIESLERFYERAMAGEFAQAPHGAASHKSADLENAEHAFKLRKN